MYILVPLVSAVLQATSLVLDKVALSMRGVSFRTYTGVSFPIYWAIILIIFIIVRPPVFPADVSGYDAALFMVSIATIVGGNLIYYRALDRDNLGELQTIDLFREIPVAIVAALFFVDERSLVVFLAALVASAVILWAHWEKKHFRIRKKTIPFLAWVIVVEPIAALAIKSILQRWNPISLQVIQIGIVSIIFYLLFSKEFEKLNVKLFKIFFAISALSAVAWILFYYSIQHFGVVYTVLISSIRPIGVYVASVLFLKEKPHWKKSVAFCVVLCTIIFVHVFQ